MSFPRFSLRSLVLVMLTLGLLGYLNFVPKPIQDPFNGKSKLYCGFPCVWSATEKHFFSSSLEVEFFEDNTSKEVTGFGIACGSRDEPWHRVANDILFAIICIFAVTYGSERFQRKSGTKHHLNKSIRVNS